MTTAYVLTDETGVYVEGGGYASFPPVEAVTLSTGLRPSDFFGHMMVEGVLTPRLRVSAPVRTVEGYELYAVPMGSRVLVHDLDGEEDMADVPITEDTPVFTISLPDEGRYNIEIMAPLPYLPTKYIVEVQND